MSFLHGVETKTVKSNSQSIPTPDANVIGLVGVAPIHHALGAGVLGNTITSDDVAPYLNKPVLSRSAEEDEALFGPDIPGNLDGAVYTIPQSLKLIRANCPGARVIVVNVLNPLATDYFQSITQTGISFGISDVITLAGADIYNLVLSSWSAGSFTEGVHFTVDYVNGKLHRIPLASGGIGNAVTFNVAYKAGVNHALSAADIIGTALAKSGLYALKETKKTYGYHPKILLAPNYSTTRSVFDVMLTIADLPMRATVLIDIVAGTTLANAIASRGSNGSVDMNIANKRGIPIYPPMYYIREIDGHKMEVYYSPLIAGVMAAKNYWESPSNTEFMGIDSPQVDIGCDFTDPNSDSNLLNAVGIMTYYSGFGTGYRTWGNHTAAFPSSTDYDGWIHMVRIKDVIDEMIENFSFPWIDKGMRRPQIDDIVEKVNGEYRKLITAGALAFGNCWFDPLKNSAEDMGAGTFVFSHETAPTPVAEHIIHETTVDLSQLKVLLAA